MHPPFYIPDTHVSHDVTHHEFKRSTKRGAAGTFLRLIPAPGWPPISPYRADYLDPDIRGLPSGQAVHKISVLRVVPEPRNGLRIAFGRFLIRMGQRMILENRPG